MRSPRLAYIALLLAACGGDGSGNGSDAAPPDAAWIGPATIQVMHQGSSVVGARVAFQDTNGSVMTEATTDSSGKATGTVHIGGYITAMWQDTNGNFLLYTFAGVKPGDDLLAKIVDPQPVTTPQSTMNVTFQDSVAGASSYHVTNKCSESTASSTPATLGLTGNPSCLDSSGTKWSLFARARSATPATLGYATAKNVIASSTTTFTTSNWAAAGAYTLTYTNAPANSQAFIASVGLMVNGVEFGDGNTGVRALLATQGLTFNATVPTSVVADAASQGMLLSFAPSGGRNMNAAVIQRTVPQPTSGPGPVVDLAATLLPRVHDPGFNSTDLSHIVVSFQADGSLAGADASAVALTWSDTAAKTHVWIAAFAPATTVTLPTLPTSAAAWAPTPTNTLSVTLAIAIDLSTTSGWDAFRQVLNRSSFNLPTNASGTAKFSESCLPGSCLF